MWLKSNNVIFLIEKLMTNFGSCYPFDKKVDYSNL